MTKKIMTRDLFAVILTNLFEGHKQRLEGGPQVLPHITSVSREPQSDTVVVRFDDGTGFAVTATEIKPKP